MGATPATTTKFATNGAARLESQPSGTSPCSSPALRKTLRIAPITQIVTIAATIQPTARAHETGGRRPRVAGAMPLESRSTTARMIAYWITPPTAVVHW